MHPDMVMPFTPAGGYRPNGAGVSSGAVLIGLLRGSSGNWHDNYDAEASPDPKWVEATDDADAAFRKRETDAKA
jgi:hypothetical protein